MGLQSAKEAIVSNIEKLANTSTNLEELSYAGASLAKLADIDFTTVLDSDIYQIGIAGTMGFGVAAIKDELLPAGYIKLTGHNDTTSPNYGKVMDLSGSVFNYRPPFYYKMTGNTISISSTYQAGYVKPMKFIREPNGYLQFAYLAGNSGGKMVSKPMLDPLSTSSAHNPISALIGSFANNYAGWVDACHASGYEPMTIFDWEVMQLISLVQSQSGASTSLCAFNDVAPYFPKGNNNNALKDVNDTSVTFKASGFLNCALTGSGSNFAKTTDNGQDCGTADINGNMWKLAFGLTYLAKTGATCASGATAVAMPSHGLAVNDVIYFGGTPSSGATYNTGAYTVTAVADGNNFTVGTALERAIVSTDGVYSPRYFRILKTTVKTSSLTAANLLDESNYDMLDLTGIIGSNSGNSFFGNGTETVLNFSTDTNSTAYKLASCGLPTPTGTSSSGTAVFGNDYIYKYLRHGLVPIVGGTWNGTAGAGSFTLYLGNYSVASNDIVGSFASVSL